MRLKFNVNGGGVAEIIPLDLLRIGEAGEVVEVVGNEGLVARLAENGLRPGSWLEALQPGDPFLLRVDATKLSLRTDGQVEVLVRLQ